MTHAARRGVLAAVVAFATLATPAQATIRNGAADDRAGDTGAGDAHDILATAARADDAGVVAIAVRLAAPPVSGTYVVAQLGTRSGTSCGAPYVLLTSRPTSGVALYGRDTASSTADFKPADIEVSGSTVALVAQDAAQLALPFDCALAATSADGGITNLYDATDALIALEPEAPPAATPTPVPTVAPTPVPAPTTAAAPPVPVALAAKLTVSLGGAPSTIRRNRTLTLKLKLANDGSKASGKVTVSLGKARGLSVRKVKTLPAFKPAQKRTLSLKVKLSRRARVETTFKVTVRSGKLRASSSLLLRIGKARKAKPAPAPKKSPLAGTFWWRNVNHFDWAWDNRALYFADGGAVYSGFPKGGLPATCAAPVAEPDEDFDTREGCLPYTFDDKSGAVTIGDKTGTFKDGKLTIDGEGYTPTVIPEAGARFDISEHKHTSFRGMCGLITGCTVTQEYLSLSPAGQFILSRSTTSTMGDPGFGPWTAVGSYPPDQHGTYLVLAGGKIRLSYADGTVKDETFVIDTNRDTGAADPLGEGVFIGEDNFYPEPA